MMKLENIVSVPHCPVRIERCSTRRDKTQHVPSHRIESNRIKSNNDIVELFLLLVECSVV